MIQLREELVIELREHAVIIVTQWPPVSSRPPRRGGAPGLHGTEGRDPTHQSGRMQNLPAQPLRFAGGPAGRVTNET